MKWIGIVAMTHLFQSLFYSAKGLWACFRDEIAFRQECALAVPHFLAVALLPLSVALRLYLILLWFLLVAIELMNTAIESVTNLASPSFHDLAAKAKDCASAAVFVIILLFFSSWLVILISIYIL